MEQPRGVKRPMTDSEDGGSAQKRKQKDKISAGPSLTINLPATSVPSTSKDLPIQPEGKNLL